MAGVLKWDLGDGSDNVNLNVFSHTYTQVGNKTVKVYKGTATGPGDITSISMDNDNLVGTLDLSSLTNLGGAFTVFGNSELTQLINPVSSQVFTSWSAQYTGLVGILDVSGLTGLGGVFNAANNNQITKILNPVSSQVFTQYSVNNCGLTGTLDVSGLTGLGGYFSAASNSGLTKILNPVSSQAFTDYRVNNCGLTGTLDVSGLTGLGGYFNANSNTNLTKILSPISSEIFEEWYASPGLVGTLDITGLTGLGGIFVVEYNSNLTEIKNPAQTETISIYTAQHCDLTGTFDMSTMYGIRYIDLSDNPNLNYIKFPIDAAHAFSVIGAVGDNLLGTLDVSNLDLGGRIVVDSNVNLQAISLPTNISYFGPFSQIRAKNCSLNQTTVDYIFDRVATEYANPASITLDLTIDLGTGKNSWPTDGIDNRDLVVVQNSFSTNTSYDVSITVIPEPTPSSINALNFDNNTAVYLGTNVVSDISTAWSSPITFSMMIDVTTFSTGAGFPVFFYLNASTGTAVPNRCYVYVQDSSKWCIQFGSTTATDPSAKAYFYLAKDISIGQVVNVEIYHAPGPTARKITDVKFNGVSKAPNWDFTSLSVLGDFEASNIGAHGNFSSFFYLRNATIWNLKVTRENKWKGWPDGSLNSSWTDRIGSLDGSIARNTSGQATTRVINL